jgi:hypothetical protein
MAYVQIRDIETGRILKSRQISDDAGSVLRRNMAESICSKNDISFEDSYVVEFDSNHSVLNNYQIFH